MKNIGLFGGTFDPIHIGHLGIAEKFVKKCDLDICFFIPAKSSPFKSGKSKMFSENERCEKIKNMINGNPKLQLCKYELEQNSEISYTVDTVIHFKKSFQDAKLFLLIGTDQAKKFHLWKNCEKILELVTVVIAERPEKLTTVENEQIEINFSGKAMIWLNNSIINITSTVIRNEILSKK